MPIFTKKLILHDYLSRIEVKIDDIIVNFIDLENLKKNKKASGRLQDLADLENLEID